MPIHTCCAAYGAGPFDAIWEYIPGECINFSKFRNVRTLVVECYGPDNLNPPIARTPWCCLGNKMSFNSCSGNGNRFRCDPSSHNEPYTLPSLREFPLLEKVIISNIYDPSGSLPASFCWITVIFDTYVCPRFNIFRICFYKTTPNRNPYTTCFCYNTI